MLKQMAFMKGSDYKTVSGSVFQLDIFHFMGRSEVCLLTGVTFLWEVSLQKKSPGLSARCQMSRGTQPRQEVAG